MTADHSRSVGETLRCFHCDELVPDECRLSVVWEGQERPMCCAGCQAVCGLIIESGQGDYYRFREGNAVRVDPALLNTCQTGKPLIHQMMVLSMVSWRRPIC
jgi:hypothetical protein